jgi:hypothetical protein
MRYCLFPASETAAPLCQEAVGQAVGVIYEHRGAARRVSKFHLIIELPSEAEGAVNRALPDWVLECSQRSVPVGAPPIR